MGRVSRAWLAYFLSLCTAASACIALWDVRDGAAVPARAILSGVVASALILSVLLTNQTRMATHASMLGAWIGAHVCILVLTLMDAGEAAAGKTAVLPVHVRGAVLQWGVYALLLGAFHSWEWVWTCVRAWSDGSDAHVTEDALMLNHSTAYVVATLAAWAEFWLGFAVCGASPSCPAAGVCVYVCVCKGVGVALALGFLLAAAGLGLRMSAMIIAGPSFTHLIAQERRPEHVLVTSGPYAAMRHPAYAGWAAWAVATQIMLGNPVCLVLYALATVRFFRDRVEYEELTLLHMFGQVRTRAGRGLAGGLVMLLMLLLTVQEYAQYASRVPVGIPFVRGLPVLATYGHGGLARASSSTT